MMRNGKAFTASIVCIFFSVFGCIVTEVAPNEREYIIENDTEFQLNIKFYNIKSGILIDGLSGIVQNRGLQLINIIEQTSEFDNNIVPYIGTDSIRVIINKNKFFTCTYNKSFFSEPINRNILKHSNYEDLGNEKYIFTITQEDYENATPCNGNCE